MERYTPKFKINEDAEEDKSVKAVNDLIDLDWEADDDSKHKAVAIIQGLFTADTKIGNDFLKQLSDFTSGLKIEDFKESDKSEKKNKKIKEAMVSYNNIDDAADAIGDVVEWIILKKGSQVNQALAYIASGVIAGIEISVDVEDPAIDEKVSKMCKIVGTRIKNQTHIMG